MQSLETHLHHNTSCASKLDGSFERGQEILEDLSIAVAHERRCISPGLWRAMCCKVLGEVSLHPARKSWQASIFGTFMTGTTASGSDHELFFDRPEAYATPIWEVRILSSPHASRNDGQSVIARNDKKSRSTPCIRPHLGSWPISRTGEKQAWMPVERASFAMARPTR